MSQSYDLSVPRSAAPVRELTTDRLRRAIVLQRFRPGERLMERELCELTGVSRTSVREALRMLESEGLVTIVPNKGPKVARMSPKHVADMYELRAELEGLAGKLFTLRATPDQVEELRTAGAAIAVATESGELEELVRCKDKFYEVMFQGAGNDMLTETFERLRRRVSTLRAVTLTAEGRRTATAEEISAIVAAAVSQDPDRAEKACRRHVEAAAAVAKALVANDDNEERGDAGE